jgi:UDP-N-acetylglucosamine 2-epimerase (non-hydrolysing)
LRVVHIVGARPNFMKIAPVIDALSARNQGIDQTLVHTGQHYEEAMSQVFFRDLGLPSPDVNLGIGSGTHAGQTAAVMSACEPVLAEKRPDWVVVVGDVNSTLAAALTASKMGIRVAHVEAGLRSFDRTMPEEHNRVVTDHLADLLLTPSKDADANLAREGIDPERIRLVGNVMIDTLVRLLPVAQERWPDMSRQLGLEQRGYALVTLHRPSNVDSPATLRAIMADLATLAESMPVIFPVHPRTRARLKALGTDGANGFIKMVESLGYLDFLSLQANARLVVTDSGGLQEETTYLGVRCITVRQNTERPITIERGTNTLAPPSELKPAIRKALSEAAPSDPSERAGIEYWDGRAGERVAQALTEVMGSG